MEEWLLKASINQLRAFLRGRFQGIGPYAADSGTREAELPPDLPLALWKDADEGLRSRLIQATQDLLGEIPGPGWTTDAIEWLCFFIDLADIKDERLTDAMAGIAHRGRWLKGTDDGPRCHVALLRTLLDMNWVAQPKFWLDLPAQVQKRYPGIVFRGLLAHDAHDAFAYLRRAVRDAKHARQIMDVLGDIMDDATRRSQVIQQLRRALPELPQAVTAHFTKWFSVYGWGELAPQTTQTRPHCTAIEDAGWEREYLASSA